MRILVTGGTGVVGRETVTRLVQKGHLVRLVSRGAEEDSREWPEGVEPFPASVTDVDALRGAAEGCEAVLHLAGIVSESPPESTFESVNVEGTATLLREAERAGAPRFVYVSSLGAERGKSGYHRSKYTAEQLVREYGGDWSICRLANVYGPGDAVISVLLQWIRVTPVLPLLDHGETEFQPIWVDDAADALVAMLEREDLAGRVLEVAGAERTCLSDLVDRFGTILDRRPLTLPVPSNLVSLAAWAGNKLGMHMPVDPGQITMLNEGSVVRAPEGNALTTVFGIQPTPLADGLRRLCDGALEQLPDEGVGALERRQFTLDVQGARLDASGLITELRGRMEEFTPWTLGLAPEPGTPTVLEEGETLTMSLPGRGNIQVRVARITDTSLTMVTLAGHPLAGAVRIAAEDLSPGRLRLMVLIHDRTAGLLDWVLMHSVGSTLQAHTWETLLHRLADASGGSAVGEVEEKGESLDGDSAREAEAWVKELVLERRQRAKREARPMESRQGEGRPRGSAHE